jgi:predicted DsbA family dithiol-disulfide isomerase
MMKIDVYADVVCPWCYIGESRLEKALAARPDLAVERHWRPFQLRPDMPAGGLARAEVLGRKFGGAERLRVMDERLAEVGAADGIRFAWERVINSPNTVDAHRLILFAAERGLEWPLAHALFAAYFTDGHDLNDHDQLVAAAESVGIAGEEALAYLASARGVAAVAESQQTAEELGISGVPFYVIDDRYGLSGAQPVEVFLRVLDEYAGADAAPVG